MTAGFRNFAHFPRFLLILPLILVALPGCGGDVYPESMIYPVRKDPVITSASKTEFLEPDRPGQLPLFTVKDLFDPRNPLYVDRDKPGWFVDPNGLPDHDRKELQELLEDVFGTPAHPKVDLITRDSRQLLQLDEATLREGSRLYRLHCLHCHGLTGDGRGPTSKWVNPHPRDYRPGLFKFQSVDQVSGEGPTRPPRRDDLYRTMHEGVEGTAMQSYNMLPEVELNALVSYVIHLSIRGEVEIGVYQNARPNDKGVLQTDRLPRGSMAAFIKGNRNKPGGMVRDVVDKWREAQDEKFKIVPGPYKVANNTEAFQESVKRGYAIFTDRGEVRGTCITCHTDFGRNAVFKFDDWGTMVKPRDLTKINYRGGNRPVDFYYRIHSGINGSGMLKQGKNLTPDQIWDVVNFVRTLPYPAMRKDLMPAID